MERLTVITKNLVQFFSPQTGMDRSTEGDENSFQVDPEGLLFYPALFTCLGILAFFLLSGATWEICRRSHMYKTQRAGSL